MLAASIPKNDQRARRLIALLSITVFVAVAFLSGVKLQVDLPFDVHLFAKVNAIINSVVSVLLVAGLIAVRSGRRLWHKRIMLTAMLLSSLFLVSYVCYHLLSDTTTYGGDGAAKVLYYVILASHVVLAAVILPFILFTTYRGLIAEWPQHRRLARITWPIWMYVSVTGVAVYLMISPYYQ